MNILVVGGTRFAGVHMVRNLLADGHAVTLANRGRTADDFGDAVKRVVIERTDAESIKRELGGKHFDVAYDTQAFSSNEVKYLLDAVKCDRYIEVSTLSVYSPNERIAQPESDFEPTAYPLKWIGRNDFGYDEIKRQAECAIFQEYANIPSVAVRFPLIIGTDDYTKRLYFYVEHIVKSLPMHVDNLDSKFEFIMSDEAGKFLAWLATSDFCGPINAANMGSATLGEIITYVERKSGVNAILTPDGDAASFNGFGDYGLDLSLARQIGYDFPEINTPLYKLLDDYITTARLE